MVTDGRLESVIEEARGQLTSRRSGSLVDAFESPCDGFDLFLPSLSTLAVSLKRCSMTEQIRSDLVIEVFRPPFWHQILFELPAILVSPIQTNEDAGNAFSLLCKFHC